MDVLSDLLQTVRLQSHMAFATALPPSWGFHVPARADRAPFYIIERGQGYLEIDESGERALLREGEVVCVPQGSAHAIRETPGSPLVDLNDGLMPGIENDVPSVGRHRTSGGTTCMVAGAFRFDGPAAQPLRAGMGRLIHVRPADAAADSWLALVMKLLCTEAGSALPGAQVAREHLMDVFFIHLVRASMAQHGAQGEACNGSFLRALFDPHISKAVELIHRHPEQKWTVAALAAAANMSRTAFALRFSRLAGIAPLAYARQWRMLKAADMLLHDQASLDDIATRVGYESVAAFSTTFKREVGVAPATYRHQRRNGGNGGIGTG